jgi:Collagen triple helix repeat (20 copies)/Divergent InlB B-repeat domain
VIPHAKAIPARPTAREDARLVGAGGGARVSRGVSLTSKGSSAPSPRLLALLALAIAALFAAIAAPSASAAEPHEFLEDFGAAAEPTFTTPTGMAVDPASGDLLVIDASDRTLHRFNPNGTAANFSALTSTNVIDGHAGEADATPQGQILRVEALATAAAEAQVAVAPPTAAAGTAGDIYATDGFNGHVVDVFSSTGAYLTQLTGMTLPCGVAVAPNGNVFVGDYETNKVSRFVPSAGPTYAKTGEFTTSHPCQLAATEGFVYVNEYAGGVRKFVSEGAETGTLKYVVNPLSYATISIDPFDGHLYAVRYSTAQIVEYDVSGASSATQIEPEITLSSLGQGVAIDGTTGNVYAARAGFAKVEVFGPRSGPPSQPLAIEVEGEGEVSASGIACTEAGNGTAACEEEFSEGTEVPLTATADPGSHFVEWSTIEGDEGSCSGAAASCTTGELNAPAKLEAIFAVNSGFPLTAWIAGKGTVSSSPSGLICSGEECTGSFEGAVGLTAHPETGYTFVGWLGCTHTGPTTCEVDVSAATEVVAVFLHEGPAGPEGPTGPTGPEGPTGPKGPTGPTGPKGPTGSTGSEGPTGSTGSNGANGAAGPAGAVGPAGPQGKQGPAGKVKVTCEVKGSNKVVCTVKQSGSSGRHRLRLRWRLMRGGHAVSHGATGAARLQRTLNRLRPGRYALHVQGQRKNTPIVVG